MRLNVATVFALPSDFTPQDIAGLTHKPGSYAPSSCFKTVVRSGFCVCPSRPSPSIKLILLDPSEHLCSITALNKLLPFRAPDLAYNSCGGRSSRCQTSTAFFQATLQLVYNTLHLIIEVPNYHIAPNLSLLRALSSIL